MLSNRRKRYVLYALRGADGNSMTIEQLTRSVRRMERGGSRIADGRSTAQVAEDLRERHIPELVATNAVDYDERSETARYYSVPSLEEWLEHAEYKEIDRVVS